MFTPCLAIKNSRTSIVKTVGTGKNKPETEVSAVIAFADSAWKNINNSTNGVNSYGKHIINDPVDGVESIMSLIKCNN